MVQVTAFLPVTKKQLLIPSGCFFISGSQAKQNQTNPLP